MVSNQEALRIHSLMPFSRANGPGRRSVLWVQGCTLGCPGCFNPHTHPPKEGESVPVNDLVDRLRALQGPIEGLTISGGEPLQQIRPLVQFLKQVRQKTTLSVVLFSGYRWEEIQRMPAHSQLLANLDVLIAGRYEAAQRLGRDLRGSANKSLHFLTGRYSEQDFTALPEAEISIGVDGEVLLSGIDPIR